MQLLVPAQADPNEQAIINLHVTHGCMCMATGCVGQVRAVQGVGWRCVWTSCCDAQADHEDPGYAAAAAADRKRIDPLPPVDHDSISYDDVAKDFYEEAPDVAALTPAQARMALHASFLGSASTDEARTLGVSAR